MVRSWKSKRRIVFSAATLIFSWGLFIGVLPVKITRGEQPGPAAVWASPPYNSFGKISSPKEGRKYKKRPKAGGQTDVRRWLFLFGALSAPAAVFLAYRAVSSGTNLSEEVEGAAVKIAAALLLAWLFLYLYHMTGFWFWLALIPWVGIGAATALILPFARRFYHLKFGIASFPGGWICSNCGIENDKIFLECIRCKNPKKN